MAQGETGLPTHEVEIDGVRFRFRKMGSEEGKRTIWRLLAAAAPMLEAAKGKGITLANWRQVLGLVEVGAVGEALRIFIDRLGEDAALDLVGRLEKYSDVKESGASGWMPLDTARELLWPRRWALLPKFVWEAFSFQFGPFSIAG